MLKVKLWRSWHGYRKQRKGIQEITLCNEEDLSPISSAVAPLRSTQIIVVDAYSLSFSDAKNHHQMKKINYLMIISTKPPDLLAPKDRSPSTNQRIVQELITYPGAPPVTLTLPLKILCWNPWRVQGLGGTSHLFSFLGPIINLCLLQTPTFRFVWPHCVGHRNAVW